MSYKFCNDIDLFVEGRITKEDARRQERTAREILNRFEGQPGLILADEVGMGKTFVALAVAVSVALSDTRRRPIVVMVPPSLKAKWPRDFQLFREKCLPARFQKKLKFSLATRAVEFLKLLDDPPARKKSIIFLTHGAMSRGLTDGWVKLALIQRALYRRHNITRLKNALCRNMGMLLQMGWVDRKNPALWAKLLERPAEKWLSIMQRMGIDPENDDNPDTDDDPVPEAVMDVLDQFDFEEVYNALKQMPLRTSKNLKKNVRVARQAINKAISELWGVCVKSLKLKLPLLILDEAHHLKNSQTRLASLFNTSEAADDAHEWTKGALSEVFERMLFLTATPFQLGHAELCSVLNRFEGVSWKSSPPKGVGRKEYQEELKTLRDKLDETQESALRLDLAWSKLNAEDLHVNGKAFEDLDDWWTAVRNGGEEVSTNSINVLAKFNGTLKKMRESEKLLKKYVIRHSKPKQLSGPFDGVLRRHRLVGRTIIEGDGLGNEETPPGLSIDGNALLPFLLAARAAIKQAERRPVFSEGLASSFEAFLKTRRKKEQNESATDTDDNVLDVEAAEIEDWYLVQIENALPKRSGKRAAMHPKIAATVSKAQELWLQGEKVLIFCHYIATGVALRQYLSNAIMDVIVDTGSKKLKCPKGDVVDRLDNIGRRFFVEDSSFRMAYEEEMNALLDGFPALAGFREGLNDIVRRYIRTPSFLIRFFPLGDDRFTRETLLEAFARKDASGLTLRAMIENFLTFLEKNCGEEERGNYIKALSGIQTGGIRGLDVRSRFSEDEIQGEKAEILVPNVRLVNGSTKSDTRQNLMLTFNTPFYPDIMIASSVMAEGVDLHLNCRYVIHHDLCWNPSMLEQRTGRIDRIGAKVEKCGQPINVFIPYISETQDEKMYRVVMDRERWFKVVMGENFRVDTRTTDKIAERIPLPLSLAEELAFDLRV